MKPASYQFLDRDLSILSFNQRVLSLAQRHDYPLLERLKYLCIVANNLDEFFEVRMDAQLDAMRNAVKKGVVNAQTFVAVSQLAHTLVKQQYHIYNNELMPALKAAGVEILSGNTRTEQQKKWVANYFLQHVKPLLLPIALDLAHPVSVSCQQSLAFYCRAGAPR